MVITRNRADRVVDHVERLLVDHDDWPVIVVDDASDDDTTHRLRRRFADRITTIHSAERRGPSARNIGVEAADTPVVAFADDDSWWAPGALRHAADVLARHPSIALVAASVVVEPGGRADPIVDAFARSPLPRLAGWPTVLGFLACGAVVRRDAFRAVGGFHPLLHVGGEEELLALDVRAAGWRLVHVPTVVAHHRPDRIAPGRSGRSERETYDRLVTAWLRRPARVAARTTLHAAASAATEPATRRGLVSAITRWRALARERRVVPHFVEAEIRMLEKGPS